MRASIIIVNYNGWDTIGRCLQSVLATTGDGIQVIVVDNASSDGSAQLVARDFAEVQLILSETNLGFGGANNLGAQHAAGNILIFLNPDTIVEAGWLEGLLAPLQADPGIGIVTPKILLANDPDRINTCANTTHLTGLTLCRGLNALQSEYSIPDDVIAVSGAACAIRHDVFLALGGFDADFFLYLEDTDLSWRAWLAGWRCIYTPHSRVYHHYALRIGPNKIFYQERNRYLLLLKNLRWSTLVALLPALFIAECVTWIFVFYRDRANLGNKARAYVWIWNHLHIILWKRRRTQAMRVIRDRELIKRSAFRLDYSQVDSRMKAIGWIIDGIFFACKMFALAVVWR